MSCACHHYRNRQLERVYDPSRTCVDSPVFVAEGLFDEDSDITAIRGHAFTPFCLFGSRAILGGGQSTVATRPARAPGIAPADARQGLDCAEGVRSARADL